MELVDGAKLLIEVHIGGGIALLIAEFCGYF